MAETTEMFEAVCLRDTVQDEPYQYFKKGKTYVISEDCPVRIHFERIDGKGGAPQDYTAPAPDAVKTA